MKIDSRVALKTLIPIVVATAGIITYAESKFAPKEATKDSLTRIEEKLDKLIFFLMGKK